MRTPLQIALESAASTGTVTEQEYCFFHLLNEEMMEKLMGLLESTPYCDISESSIATSDKFDGKARIRRYIKDGVSTYEYTVKHGRSGDAVQEDNTELTEVGYLALLSTVLTTNVRRRYAFPYHDVTKTREDGSPLVWDIDIYIDRTTLTYSTCIKLELEYDTPPCDDVASFIPYEYKETIIPRRMNDEQKAFMDDMYSSRWNVKDVVL